MVCVREGENMNKDIKDTIYGLENIHEIDDLVIVTQSRIEFLENKLKDLYESLSHYGYAKEILTRKGTAKHEENKSTSM